MLPPAPDDEADWQQQAACRGFAWWFQRPISAEHRRICASCPVTKECRALADVVQLSMPTRGRNQVVEVPGIWGGETPSDRCRRLGLPSDADRTKARRKVIRV